MALLKIDDLRVRVGLLDTDLTKDVQITDCYTLALNIIEAYLDRKILRGTYTETFFNTKTALVKAWPIASLTTVGGNAPDSNLRIDKDKGIIFNVNWDNVELVYVGGWPDAEIPSVITLAMNAVFDELWVSMPGFANPAIDDTGESEIKKFSINGVTMEYFGSADKSTVTGQNAANVIPSNFKNLLDYYRRESLIGAG